MSIADLRKNLKAIPGISSLTMSYKDGGKTEVYSTSAASVEVPAGASDKDIEEAFKKKLQSSPTLSISPR